MTACLNCEGVMHPFCAAIDENRRLGTEHFNYSQCLKCGVISLTNVPDNLGEYYGSDYYALPTKDRLAELAEKENAKMDAIKPYWQRGTLLEIGPAFGVFSSRAQKEGFSVSVIERDARCCEYLREVIGANVFHSTDPVECLYRMPKHDVIALWHVIEHLLDPFAFIDAAASNLSPNGVLVMGVPNPLSTQFRMMGAAWPHLDAPRHVHLIPASAIIERGKQHGLDLCYLTSDDDDARSWNRFGWQRLLMNRMPGRVGRAIGFLLGAAFSVFMAPLERLPMKGSAYTIVLRKTQP